MKSRLMIALTGVVLLAATVHGLTLSAADKALVENGLAFGEKIGEALKSDGFSELMQNIGNKMAPFLGALGPLMGLILAFVPSGPSLEEKIMERFDKIDQKFDLMDVQFDEVKRLVKWENMQVKIADEEQSIRYLHMKYRSVITAPVDEKEGFKRDFITQYESDYQGAGYKLFDAATANDATTFKNVFRGCMEFTGNDRKQVETFMLGYFGLVMKAMVVEMAYYKWDGYTLTGSRTNTWLNRMETLKLEMKKIENGLIDFHAQFSKDLDEFIPLKANLNNGAFADQLYAKLSTKFYWRYWAVVVSKDIQGSNKHRHGQNCGAIMKFQQHGKNVIAVSVDKKHSSFNAAKANSEIVRIQNWMGHNNKSPIADYMYNRVEAGLRTSCRPFAYIAFVCRSCNPDLQVRAASNHMVKRKLYWLSFPADMFSSQVYENEMDAVFFG
ncbi:uncharacterized protein LOC135499849 [Lineus longissimus]|uniref:uncharacterized protein LOC135499849 n=1 Tax=Lineus longissimus TaxID=88925 RepID=UPI00315D6B36